MSNTKNNKKKKSPRPANKGRSSAIKKTKKQKMQRNNRIILAACIVTVFVLIFISMAAIKYVQEKEAMEKAVIMENNSGPAQWQKEGAPYIDVQLLTSNEYSRPQIAMNEVKYIAIHYTANPGATAMDNRNYFENLASTHETKVSSHFVVGLEGEVVQCIPTAEISYATNERNVDTISIECCHMDETGVFEQATYDSVVKLAAWLCTRFNLTEENVIRHYDVTGKNCPKYYVEHSDAWDQMKADIAAQIQEDRILQENL